MHLGGRRLPLEPHGPVCPYHDSVTSACLWWRQVLRPDAFAPIWSRQVSAPAAYPPRQNLLIYHPSLTLTVSAYKNIFTRPKIFLPQNGQFCLTIIELWVKINMHLKFLYKWGYINWQSWSLRIWGIDKRQRKWPRGPFGPPMKFRKC